LLHEIRATKIGNSESNGIEIDPDKDVKSQNSEGFNHMVKDESTPATEFGNVLSDGATNNSNSINHVNITIRSPNPLTTELNSCENLNNSSKKDLISEMGRVGCSSNMGIIQVNKRV
jgi:hypothetical protein